MGAKLTNFIKKNYKDEKADIDEILGTIKDGGSGDDGKKKKHTET